MSQGFYIDTCIWLNLFKKEGDENKGFPYWKIAQDFIERVMFSNDKIIIYSGVILRELQIKLSEKEYNKKRDFFENEPKLIKVEVLQEDKINARKLESKYNFEISFYDLIHISIVKRLNIILVTRDKQLINIAKENNVCAKRPEES